MEECHVCFELKPLVRFSCGHEMCKTCANKYVKFSPRCHMCRSVITKIHPNLDITYSKQCKCINVCKKKGDKLGLTLITKDDAVCIEKRSNNARHKFKRGDILKSINFIPCYNSLCVAEILKETDIVILHIEPSDKRMGILERIKMIMKI